MSYNFKQHQQSSKRKHTSSPFAAVPGYQKKVCTKLMKCSTCIKPKKLVDCSYKNTNYIKLECPRQNCSKKATGIFTEEKTGYTNAFKHLVSCYGGEDELFRLFNDGAEDELSEMKSEPTGIFFNAASVTEEQKDLYRWADLILEENLPLCSIEKRSFRSFFQINA